MNTSRNNKWAWALLALLIIGVGAWLFLSNKSAGKATGDLASNTAHEAKENLAKLTMEVASMSITGIEKGHISVANTVVISNPLPVPLNISRLDYAVQASSLKVAGGSYTKPIRVPALGSTIVTLPMEVFTEQLDKVNDAANAENRDSTTYHFLHTIHTDVPIAGKRKIPYNVKERLPVLRSPKVKLGKLDIEKLGLKSSGMDVTMHVTNPNTFTVRMLDGRCTMSIDGEHTMEGTMQKEVVLPPKQTTPVQMHMKMKTGKALKTGWKMLFDKKDTRYKMTFDSKLLSDAELLENSTMHLTDEGSLKDLKDAIENQSEE